VDLIDRLQIPGSTPPSERLLLTLLAAVEYLSRRALLTAAPSSDAFRLSHRALLVTTPPSRHTESDFLDRSSAEPSSFLSTCISTSPPAGDPLSTVDAVPTGKPHSLVSALLFGTGGVVPTGNSLDRRYTPRRHHQLTLHQKASLDRRCTPRRHHQLTLHQKASLDRRCTPRWHRRRSPHQKASLDRRRTPRQQSSAQSLPVILTRSSAQFLSTWRTSIFSRRNTCL
jgi:hypothetical protein